eukprot:12519258-Prorocentrum_lima.AAC.1
MDVCTRSHVDSWHGKGVETLFPHVPLALDLVVGGALAYIADLHHALLELSLIHISEPTRLDVI